MTEENNNNDGNEVNVEELQSKISQLENEKATIENKYHTQYAANANLDKKLKELEGIDPDKYHMMEAQFNKIQKEPKQKEGELPGDLKEKWQNMETQLQQLTQQNKALQCTDKVMQQASAHFKEDLVGIIKSDAEREADLVDGQIVFRDDKNNIRFKAPETPFTVDDWVNEKIAKYPSAVKSKQFKGNKSENETFSGNIKDINASNYLELVQSGRLNISKMSMAEQAKIADIADEALRNK